MTNTTKPSHGKKGSFGELLIVGNVGLLPSRIKVAEASLKPKGATIDFWDEWSKVSSNVDIVNSIKALRKQSR